MRHEGGPETGRVDPQKGPRKIKRSADLGPPRRPVCAYLVTLHRFDIKVRLRPKMGPLIPCERRLQEMEISEIQEVTFEARFGNRDYGRPYGHILVTLRGFD